MSVKGRNKGQKTPYVLPSDDVFYNNYDVVPRMNIYESIPRRFSRQKSYLEPEIDYDDDPKKKDNGRLNYEQKKRRFLRIMSRFAERTSMQGVPYINSARLKSAKFVWIVLTMAAIGVMLFHLYFLFSNYLGWPKVTKVEIDYSNLQLPAITICNMNVIRKSQLNKASKQMQELLAHVDPIHIKNNPSENSPSTQPNDAHTPNLESSLSNNGNSSPSPTTVDSTNGLSNSQPITESTVSSQNGYSNAKPVTKPTTVSSQNGNPTSQPINEQTTLLNTISGTRRPRSSTKPRHRQKRLTKELEKFNFTKYVEFYDDYYIDPSTHELKKVDTKNKKRRPPRDPTGNLEAAFKRLYMDHQRSKRFAMGHRINDMLIRCSFSGRQCYAENFTLFQSPDYGNCFTIQSKDFISTESGRNEGLTLILFLENMDFIHGITDGYGARLTIHDPDSLPFPSEDGMFVQSFADTQIGLKMVHIKRLGPPHGACEEGVDYENKYGIKYSRRACMSLCKQFQIIQTCYCYSDELEEYLVHTNNTQHEKCKTKMERACASAMSKMMKKNQLSCDCKSPCSEIQFMKTITSRQWPTEEFAKMLLESACQRFPHRCERLLQDKANHQRLSLNFLKLTIYYEDLNYEAITEKQEIEDSQFLSDVGGALGLWIGLSVLSMFEVFQFFSEIIQFMFNKAASSGKLKEKKTKQRTESDTSNKI